MCVTSFRPTFIRASFKRMTSKWSKPIHVDVFISLNYVWNGVEVKTQDSRPKGPGFESRLTVHRKSRRLFNAFVIECDKRERGLPSNTGVVAQ